MRARNSGPRANMWSRSKYTNQNIFDPQEEEISQVIEKYYDEYSKSPTTIFRQRSLHPDFLMPVTLGEVEALMADLPQAFTDGIKAVFLLGGSRQQEKSWSRFCYGRYGSNLIYLHPFPRARLRRAYKRPPAPHRMEEYRRAGAEIYRKADRTIVEFTPAALRDFYLRDVLMHEIGHHNDRHNFGKKRQCREEPFAEWFATEYGFRLRR